MIGSLGQNIAVLYEWIYVLKKMRPCLVFVENVKSVFIIPHIRQLFQIFACTYVAWALKYKELEQ